MLMTVPTHQERVVAYNAVPRPELELLKSIEWLQAWWRLSQKHGGRLFSPRARPSLVRGLRRLHEAGRLNLRLADGSEIPAEWLDPKAPISVWKRGIEGWVRPGKDWILPAPTATFKKAPKKKTRGAA
jgi:hypothetical protein